MASPSLMLKAARAGGGSPLPGPPALPQRPGRSPRLGTASLCPSQLQGRAPHRSGLLGEQLRHTPGVPPCPRLRETEGDRQAPYQSRRRVGIRNGKPEQPCCSLKIHSSGIWKEEGGRGVPRVDSGLARGCPWPGQPSLCPAARRLSASRPPGGCRAVQRVLLGARGTWRVEAVVLETAFLEFSSHESIFQWSARTS